MGRLGPNGSMQSATVRTDASLAMFGALLQQSSVQRAETRHEPICFCWIDSDVSTDAKGVTPPRCFGTATGKFVAQAEYQDR